MSDDCGCCGGVRGHDVFPPRYLPGSSQQWGRTVERRVLGAETGIIRARQTARNQNRDTASKVSSLAYQLQGIDNTLAGVQTATEDVQAAQEALPVPASYTASTSNFSVSTSWATKASLLIPAVPGKTCNALIRWDVQYEAVEYVSGYGQSRVTYSGGIPGSGTKWLGYSYLPNFDLYLSNSFAHVAESDSEFTVNVQLRNLEDSSPANVNNLIRINVFAVYA